MKQSKSQAYTIYQESLDTLLKIPDVLSSKLVEIDHDEVISVGQATTASTATEGWISSHEIDLDRELLSAREKLRICNMNLPTQKAFAAPAIPIFTDAIQQLRLAGMAIDRAIRDEQKAREESARRAEEEKRKQAEERSKMVALIAERKRRTRNIFITIAVGAVLTVILFLLAFWIPGLIAFLVTFLAAIPQIVSRSKVNPYTTQVYKK